MIGTFGAAPAFDAPFYWSQVATMVVWLLALLTVRWQRRLKLLRGLALGFAIVTEIALPAAWSIAWPATGLDIFRIPPASVGTLFESALSCLWAVRSAANALVPRGPVLRPFVVTALVSLVLWTLWTMWLLFG
jgi:hypothetical protein